MVSLGFKCNLYGMELNLRSAKNSDLTEIQELFVNTVQSVCKEDYDSLQRKVWASSVENKTRWLSIISDQTVVVAEIGKKIVGFIALKEGSYLDLLYVHKDFQRMGIAQALYNEIEPMADAKELTSDVSITARPFFEKNGFKVIERQHVKRQEVDLVNFKMTKFLNQ